MKAAAFYSNSANTSQLAAGMKQSSDQTCPEGYSAVHRGVVYCLGFLIFFFIILAVPQTAKAQYCDPDNITWGDWSGCSTNCGIGTRTTSGTDECGGSHTATEGCEDNSGYDTTWNGWSACSNTCGTGERTNNGTNACQGSVTATEGCYDDSGCPVCDGRDKCGVVPGCDSYQNPKMCGEAPGYQECNSGTCDDGVTTWTRYCKPDCSDPNADCYSTPSCTVTINCNDHGGDAYCAGGGCPPTSCTGAGRCGAGGNCWTDCTACQTPRHLTCQNGVCESVGGAGDNTCSTNSQCSGGGTTKHLECRNEACVEIDGAGDNLCLGNANCDVPSTPTISILPAYSCISGPVTDPAQAVRINWTNPPFAVGWADISSNNFATPYYHKAVSGTSTTAPDGFNGFNGISGALIISPETTYYARVSNSVGNSASTNFSIPFCAPVITSYECPFPGTTATITWTYNPSANHYAINYGSGRTHLSPGVYTTSFPTTPGQTYNWRVMACNNSTPPICGNAATGSVFCDNTVAPWIKTTGGDVHTQLRLNTR